MNQETSQAAGNMLGFAESITAKTVYLMGMSFVLGSLFTIFVLLVLDFMRRNAKELDA